MLENKFQPSKDVGPSGSLDQLPNRTHSIVAGREVIQRVMIADLRILQHLEPRLAQDVLVGSLLLCPLKFSLQCRPGHGTEFLRNLGAL